MDTREFIETELAYEAARTQTTTDFLAYRRACSNRSGFCGIAALRVVELLAVVVATTVLGMVAGLFARML